MDDYVRVRFNCIERVHFFGQKPELAPLTPKEISFLGGVATAWNGLKAYMMDQGTGNREFREGATERLLMVKEIWAMNRRIADIARSIAEEGVDPGMAEKFRLPRDNRTYLLAAITALAFADQVEQYEALFTERNLAPTFLDDLRGHVTAFETASGIRVGGLAVQTTGTAGLELLAKDGLKNVRMLRPLIREKLKNQPALQAAWDLAARVAKRGSVEDPVEPPPPPPEGSGS
jgi:hypothetical protein